MTTHTERLRAHGIEVPEVEALEKWGVQVRAIPTAEEAKFWADLLDEYRVVNNAALDALVTVLEDRLVFEAGMQAGADSLRAERDRLKAQVENADEANAANVALAEIWKSRAEQAEGTVRVQTLVIRDQTKRAEEAEADCDRLRAELAKFPASQRESLQRAEAAEAKYEATTLHCPTCRANRAEAERLKDELAVSKRLHSTAMDDRTVALIDKEQAEAELAALKARFTESQVCGSCTHYDSFGSATFCRIECPERVHAYDHQRYFDSTCQYEPSQWDDGWQLHEEAHRDGA